MPSSFTVLVLLRFLVSWSIASTTYQSSSNIIGGGDVLHGYDLTIEDKDIEYDSIPEEDYLDNDIWSNETIRKTRQDAYNSVTKSSTGTNYSQLIGTVKYTAKNLKCVSVLVFSVFKSKQIS